MRITHRMIADRVNFNLQRSLRRLENYSNQLSTGKAFHKPSENPVGVGRVMSYSAAINRNEQYRLNMNQTKGWLDNTEYALQNGLDVVQRVRELTVYGANESLSSEDRQAIAPEVLEFIDHLIGVANTESNGLYMFGGHQTLKVPFKREKVFNLNFAGGGLDQSAPPTASGLQNGAYGLSQERGTALTDRDAAAVISGSFLQGNAETILGRADLESVVSEVNASVLIEVTAVDPENGTVDYLYVSHQYDRDGNYQKMEGEFSLNYGDPVPATISLGDAELEITGLDLITPVQAGGIRVGDRAVLDITASAAAGGDYDRLSLTANHRGGQSQATYTFNQGALDHNTFDLKYFSLQTFDRSPEKGQVYDGELQIAYLDLESAEPAFTFVYDSQGFPVYQGDHHDRIQEISPHQEMVMNTHGLKAFGENQEVFEAVFSVYNALIDNDREALGGTVLAKLDQAVDHLLERLAEVGARSNRLEAMHNTLFSENIHLQEVRSNIEDIDLAQVITEYMMQENAYKAALSTASMMLQPTLVDYLR